MSKNESQESSLLTNRNYSETFHLNPQLQLILTESETAILSLSQHSVTHPMVRSKLGKRRSVLVF
jgi:hypothetical protein